LSRFYASIAGERKPVTCRGSKGILAHIRGWKSGIKVTGFVNSAGEDEFLVETTGGSEDPSVKRTMEIVDEHGFTIVKLVNAQIKITEVRSLK